MKPEILKRCNAEIDCKLTMKDMIDVMVTQEEERLTKERNRLEEERIEIISKMSVCDSARLDEAEMYMRKKYKKVINAFLQAFPKAKLQNNDISLLYFTTNETGCCNRGCGLTVKISKVDSFTWMSVKNLQDGHELMECT